MRTAGREEFRAAAKSGDPGSGRRHIAAAHLPGGESGQHVPGQHHQFVHIDHDHGGGGVRGGGGAAPRPGDGRGGH